MTSEQKSRSPKPRRLRRAIGCCIAIVIVATIGMELFARFGLGLGDPPLTMRDADIEYLAQPSRTYKRFGNTIRYNQWSMRSDEFPKNKASSEEFRVIVLGDSVVNGGTQIDHAAIATELIRTELASELGRSIVVGNIAAGSWGPPNLLAYVKKFGLFDADAIVIALSSHDAADVPTFGPLGVDAPERTPVLALQEAVQRYLPRYLPAWLRSDESESSRNDDQLIADREQSLNALRELLHSIKQSGARLLIMQHAEASELHDGMQPGHADIQSIASELGIDCIDLAPTFRQSLDAGRNPYRDNIHPNEIGQRLLAEAILEWVLESD